MKPKIQVLEGPFCLYAYKYCLLEDQTYQGRKESSPLFRKFSSVKATNGKKVVHGRRRYDNIWL